MLMENVPNFADYSLKGVLGGAGSLPSTVEP